MKRTRLRRKSRLRLASKRRPTVKQLDALARAVVFARDQGKCQKTGDTQRLQWCHVHTRRLHSLRWDPDNSLMLTAGTHLWWHHHPLEATQWFIRTFPERALRLHLKRQTPQRVDLNATRLYLESLLNGAERRKVDSV